MNNATPGRARIEDVAAGAGVSVATVSRALRGLSNVAPATRERVVAVAESLHYRADPHASRLAAGRTQTIGMGVPLLGAWYFSQVVAGAEAVLAAEGYDLLLVGIGSGEERKRVVREWTLLQKRVDGLILVDLRMDTDEIDALAFGDAHVVTVGDQYGQFPSVTVENRDAARRAVEHLVGLGHRRIGLIGDGPGGALTFSVPAERRAGYRDALETAGVPVDPSLDVPGDFSVDGGAEGMLQLLALPRPPTAVFAMSDEMAMGALKVLRAKGVAVPTEMSVVGFDNHELSDAFGLTTMAQPVVGSGGLAARFLLDRFGGDRTAHHLVEDTHLIVRETTARVLDARDG